VIRMRMRRSLLAAAVAVVVAGGSAVAAAELGGPSYTHRWCAPVIAQIEDGHQSPNAMVDHLEPYAHVRLVGRYIGATAAFVYAYGVEQADAGQVVDDQSLRDIGAAVEAGNAWGRARDAIMRACGAS